MKRLILAALAAAILAPAAQAALPVPAKDHAHIAMQMECRWIDVDGNPIDESQRFTVYEDWNKVQFLEVDLAKDAPKSMPKPLYIKTVTGAFQAHGLYKDYFWMDGDTRLTLIQEVEGAHRKARVSVESIHSPSMPVAEAACTILPNNGAQ